MQSKDPEGDPRLSVDPLMGQLGLSIEQLTRQLVDQASMIMNASETAAAPSARQSINRPGAVLAGGVAPHCRHGARCRGCPVRALGVIGADGLLEQFLHVGLDDDAVREIGEPQGRGVLALIEDPKPIRLTGFPTMPARRAARTGILL